MSGNAAAAAPPLYYKGRGRPRQSGSSTNGAKAWGTKAVKEAAKEPARLLQSAQPDTVDWVKGEVRAHLTQKPITLSGYSARSVPKISMSLTCCSSIANAAS